MKAMSRLVYLSARKALAGVRQTADEERWDEQDERPTRKDVSRFSLCH